MPLTCDQMTVDWPEQWPRPDESTTAHNRRMVRKFARDFEYRDPASIERSEARSWAMANPGIARYVRTMFNDYLDEGLIESNPFSELRLPRVGERPIVVPTQEQLTQIVEGAVAGGDVLMATQVIFASEVGLRFGEQGAVIRPDSGAIGNHFSEDRRRLTIDWQRGRDGKLKRPKTEASRRRVMVSAEAQLALNRALAADKLRRHGRTWPLGAAGHRQRWSNLRREVGVWFRWHDLRHYAATQLLDRGATVDDVAVQLGCDVDQIRRRYGHPSPEKALDRLEGLDHA